MSHLVTQPAQSLMDALAAQPKPLPRFPYRACILVRRDEFLIRDSLVPCPPTRRGWILEWAMPAVGPRRISAALRGTRPTCEESVRVPCPAAPNRTQNPGSMFHAAAVGRPVFYGLGQGVCETTIGPYLIAVLARSMSSTTNAISVRPFFDPKM